MYFPEIPCKRYRVSRRSRCSGRTGMPKRVSGVKHLWRRSAPWTARNSFSLSAIDRPFRDTTTAGVSGMAFAGPGSTAKVGGGTSVGR